MTGLATAAQQATQKVMKLAQDEGQSLVATLQTMAEAAEVGHWTVLKTLNERARHPQIEERAGWALPIQQRHLRDVLDGSKTLAANENPDGTE